MPCQTLQQDTSPRQQLFRLLEQLVDDSTIDASHRSSMRRAVHMPATLGVIAGEYKPLYRAWATDLSLNGVGLLTEHDVPINTFLHVNLEAKAGEELLMPIRICYVSKLLGMTYRIGGTFSFSQPNDRNPLLF